MTHSLVCCEWNGGVARCPPNLGCEVGVPNGGAPKSSEPSTPATQPLPTVPRPAPIHSTTGRPKPRNTMAERLTISLPGRSLVIDASPLRASSFAPFGDVVENPQPTLHPSSAAATIANSPSPLPFNPVSANQGSAIKYQHVTRFIDLYAQAPSSTPSTAVASMFVCASRTLLPDPSSSSSSSEIFPVTVLERHPYTTQTFIPLSASPAKRYLVIVAPSLPPSEQDRNLPVPASPCTNSPHVKNHKLPGRGLPDLRGLRAFIATSEQAVTYAAGTWHAPMAALGEPGTALDFVVVQFANGVPVEDCQEVFLDGSVVGEEGVVPGEGAVLVVVPKGNGGRGAKL
ncbi:ureidoglycolate hydrolase-domain-containing protein [Cercophora newfieldiana]|uniref:Ureidoglycolate hydrolase-domain-containing protein n=1 Tax=Cercophora newfieldiana TaxID=92897 RepID=A0AA40CP96_9PEZI|nr:ureidoglycolate hydrolase-domain-containing protein [Cercophora newfieldiana]